MPSAQKQEKANKLKRRGLMHKGYIEKRPAQIEKRPIRIGTQLVEGI